MIKDSYMTVVCQAYNMTATHDAIDRALIENTVFKSVLPNGQPLDNIKLVVGVDMDLPPFSHPITHNDTVITDARSFVTIDGQSPIGYKITNGTDFKLAVLRSQLQSIAVAGNYNELSTVHALPVIAYGRWISDGIVRRLGLNPDDQMKITVVACAYYLSQFSDNERNWDRLAIQIARYTHIKPEIVSELLNDIDSLNTLDDMVECIKASVDNSRIEMLTVGSLLVTVTYGWKGSNAREIMGVSVEYPPTWLAVVAFSIEERLYRNTPISVITQNIGRRGINDEYIMGITRLVRG